MIQMDFTCMNFIVLIALMDVFDLRLFVSKIAGSIERNPRNHFPVANMISNKKAIVNMNERIYPVGTF